jgi:phospholipid/cholesterol/gamma-HCH transport system substrate-binding protein
VSTDTSIQPVTVLQRGRIRDAHAADAPRPLPPMPRLPGRYREARVGLFAILAVFAIWFALMTLTSPTLFRGRYILTTSVPDAAGIRKGDPVQMRGVNIGRVIAFGIGEHGVRLQLEIEKAYTVPSDSRAELRSSGLLAGMTVDVVPGRSARPASWGDELPGGKGRGVFDQVQGLAGEADKAAQRLQRLLSDRTIQNVEDDTGEAGKVLRQASGVLAEQRGELAALTTSLRKSAQGVERVTTGPELERVVKQMDELTRRVDTLVANMNRSATSLDAVLARVAQGEGTLGKLSRDDVLYERVSLAATDFDKAAVQLQKLVEDVRRQPKKYINLSLF